MRKENYDADRDIFETGGHRGMYWADRIIEEAGGIDAYFLQLKEKSAKPKRKTRRRPKIVNYHDPVHLERVARIVLMPPSHLGTGERVWTGARK